MGGGNGKGEGIMGTRRQGGDDPLLASRPPIPLHLGMRGDRKKGLAEGPRGL